MDNLSPDACAAAPFLYEHTWHMIVFHWQPHIHLEGDELVARRLRRLRRGHRLAHRLVLVARGRLLLRVQHRLGERRHLGTQARPHHRRDDAVIDRLSYRKR